MTNGPKDGLDRCPVCGKPYAGEDGAVCDCPAKENASKFESLIAEARSILDSARYALGTGDYDKAARLAQSAAEKYDGVYQEALALQVRAAVKTADFALAYGLADALENEDEKAKFIGEIAEAEKRDVAAKERFNLALTAVREGRLKEAETELTEAISLAPYLAEPYRLLVKVYAEMNETEDARHYFRELELRFPGDPSLYELRRLLVEIADFEKAEAKFKYNPGTFGLILAGAQIVLLIIIIVILLTR